jgi:hypothetical protein
MAREPERGCIAKACMTPEVYSLSKAIGKKRNIGQSGYINELVEADLRRMGLLPDNSAQELEAAAREAAALRKEMLEGAALRKAQGRRERELAG